MTSNRGISLAAASTINVDTGDTLTYAGVINDGSGSFALTKAAAATLVLSRANTYDGGTTVSRRTVRAGIASSGSAGSVSNGPFGTGTVTVGSGFTIDLGGFNLANALNLSGAGIGSNGALINSGAAATASGAVTIAANTSIGGSGAITMSNAISASTHTVSFVNGAAVTAENTSNNIASVTITNSALVLKTTAALTVNASSLSGVTTLQTVSAGRDITVSGAITNNTNGNTLTLMASRDVLVSAAIAGSSGKSLTTNLYSDVDNTGGGGFKSTVSTASISTFGGNITIRGGTTDTTAGCAASFACIAGHASHGGSQADPIGVLIWAPLNAAGGNIAVYGRGNPTSTTAGVGIHIDVAGTVLSTSGTGTIILDGVSTGAQRGIYHVQGDITAGTGSISFTASALNTGAFSGYRMNAGSITSSGALSISGTGGSNEYGVWIYGAGGITVGGDITLNGQNASRNIGIYINGGKVIRSTAGNISVTAVGTQGMYFDGSLIAGNHATTPTAGGSVTMNLTGNTSHGLEINTGSLIAYGPISVTAVGSGQYAFYFYGVGAKIQSASDITINASQGTWGLTMYNDSFIQSTGGNISITSSGTSGGFYANTTGGIYASSNTSTRTATPTAGGTLTINATGGSGYGIQIPAGSLISFGAMSLTATAVWEGIYIYGTADPVRSVGNLTLSSTISGASQWGIYLSNSRILQSTAGNIDITSSSALGHGVYISGGGLVAGNDTTTPTAGGNITINSSSRANDIGGAGLRLDGTATKIIAYGDISIFANGAAAGLNVANQQGHGVILWGAS